jgi:hypothetical protein
MNDINRDIFYEILEQCLQDLNKEWYSSCPFIVASKYILCPFYSLENKYRNILSVCLQWRAWAAAMLHRGCISAIILQQQYYSPVGPITALSDSKCHVWPRALVLTEDNKISIYVKYNDI